MQNLLRPYVLFAACAAITACQTAFAHGDTELPLFVAEEGEDAGDCLTESTPCRSIGYALSRAGKGSQLRIMEGSYDVESAEDVFHLISGVVDVSGGFKPGSANGSTERGVSLLEGVPPQYRELLQGKGIQVIADSKGMSSAKQSRAHELLGLHQQLKSSIDASPCVGGFAAGLPCSNVDLLSHVGFTDISTVPSVGNDIWGFVDLNTGREYAIVGFNMGTAVFDVTDAENPLEVGFIDGQDAVWRDIKVYQFFDPAADRWKAYAFVTTDGSTDGLFVIDMTGLPHSIQRVNYPSDITRAHNVYATNTDFGTGIALTDDIPALIVAGATSNGNGRFRTYSLADPESPTLVSGGLGIGYMHDAASMLIDDPRKDSQCVNAGEFCQLLLDFNENTFEIWDVTNAATPVQLSSTPYPNVGYVHSGWWSEDKQYVFVHDELDERDSSLPTTLRVFLVSDLTSPTLAGTWSGPTNAIDHNGFVRGNRYYMSNYSRGLTILDITNPATPVETGNLDTFPFDDPNDSIFNGAWGTYPFFHSGNIAISDIDSGFYMAADTTRDVAQGKFEFASSSFAASEGQVASLTVRRTGGSTDAASVSIEVVNATTDSDDYTLNTSVLNWANGDAADQVITLSATNDGVGESMERLIVRLVNPTGGATLGNLNTASAFISDAGAAAEVNFTAPGASVAERGFGTIVAVIKRSGSAVGAASVDIST
ncbi:MAG: choice-of-anchor B family protein, partial [Woeseiaceae bacterium]